METNRRHRLRRVFCLCQPQHTEPSEGANDRIRPERMNGAHGPSIHHSLPEPVDYHAPMKAIRPEESRERSCRDASSNSFLAMRRESEPPVSCFAPLSSLFTNPETALQTCLHFSDNHVFVLRSHSILFMSTFWSHTLLPQFPDFHLEHW